MLGTELRDEQGLEGKVAGTTEGLGMLDVVTSFDSYDKRTVQVTGLIIGHESLGPVRGYEIHMGMTERGRSLPLFEIEDFAGKHADGAVSDDSMVMGSYLHGFASTYRHFGGSSFRKFRLMAIGRRSVSWQRIHDASVEESIDRIASALQSSLDMGKVLRMLGLEARK